MSQFLILDGEELPGSTAPAYTVSAAGQAFGHIPGRKLFLDPDYVYDGRAMDRVTGALTLNLDNPQTIDTFPNGAAGFRSPSEGTTGRTIQPGCAFNPSAWSFAFVARLAEHNDYHRVASAISSDVDAPSPRFGFNSTGGYFNFWDYPSNNGGSEILRYTPAVSFIDRTVLLMVTFSGRDGLRFFENGVQVAAEPEWVTPFSEAYGAGEWQILYRCRGLFGDILLYDVDLGWAEHAPYRRAIERYEMTKFGIA